TFGLVLVDRIGARVYTFTPERFANRMASSWQRSTRLATSSHSWCVWSPPPRTPMLSIVGSPAACRMLPSHTPPVEANASAAPPAPCRGECERRAQRSPGGPRREGEPLCRRSLRLGGAVEQLTHDDARHGGVVRRERAELPLELTGGGRVGEAHVAPRACPVG